jgi:hypothetical protein
MYCPDCGAENSKSQKFCTRCGTNLIAIDRAREIVGEMTSNASGLAVEPSSVLRIVALVSAVGFLSITGGAVALARVQGGPNPLFFGLGGFTALALICRYLLQMTPLGAKTQPNRPLRHASAPPPVAGATNRALGEPPYQYPSIVEDPTQQFEAGRRAKL